MSKKMATYDSVTRALMELGRGASDGFEIVSICKNTDARPMARLRLWAPSQYRFTEFVNVSGRSVEGSAIYTNLIGDKTLDIIITRFLKIMSRSQSRVGYEIRPIYGAAYEVDA